VVTYNPPASDGGSEVLSYRIEWSESATFNVASKKEVDCSNNRAKEIVTIATQTTTSLSSATRFELTVTHNGVAATTLPIRTDAIALRENEESELQSGVFCDGTNPTRPCDQTPIANTGSLQSHLEYLPNVGSVSVSRSAASVSGVYTWTVTFNDDGGNWNVVANIVNDDSGKLTNVAVNTKVVGEWESSLDCTGPQVLGGLTQGVPYFVRVTAYNKEGYGLHTDALNEFGGNSQAPMRVPGRPTATALTVVSGTQLRVTWSPPVDNGGDAITEYRVDYSTDPLFATAAVQSTRLLYIVDNGPYTTVLSGLSMGQTYYVRVFAKNSQGFGEGQAPTPNSEHPRQLPKAPLNVRTEITSTSMLTVFFNKPINEGGDAVTKFRVEWDIDAEFEGLLGMPHKGSVIVDASRDSSYTITNLNPGTRYYVRVAAGNLVGFGAASVGGATGTAPAQQVPGAPVGVSVSGESTPLHADLTCASPLELLVEMSYPIVPAHGVPCSGGGSAHADPSACPSGMGSGTQADGGSRITAYEVQWSTYADFRDTSSHGGTATLQIPASANQNGPHILRMNPVNGQALLAGQQYYIRVAARNAEGIGSYCERDGPFCDGAPLMAVPVAPC
jgi:hypothetical protein